MAPEHRHPSIDGDLGVNAEETLFDIDLWASEEMNPHLTFPRFFGRHEPKTAPDGMRMNISVGISRPHWDPTGQVDPVCGRSETLAAMDLRLRIAPFGRSGEAFLAFLPH